MHRSSSRVEGIDRNAHYLKTGRHNNTGNLTSATLRERLLVVYFRSTLVYVKDTPFSLIRET